MLQDPPPPLMEKHPRGSSLTILLIGENAYSTVPAPSRLPIPQSNPTGVYKLTPPLDDRENTGEPLSPRSPEAATTVLQRRNV